MENEKRDKNKRRESHENWDMHDLFYTLNILFYLFHVNSLLLMFAYIHWITKFLVGIFSSLLQLYDRTDTAHNLTDREPSSIGVRITLYTND